MNKWSILVAVALLMAACGQKDNEQQQPTGQKEVRVPPMVPVAPKPQLQAPSLEFGKSGQSDGPVLRMEEGQPLDMSQLMGDRKSLQDQIVAHFDTISSRAHAGKAEYQYLLGVCHEKGWGVTQSGKEAFAWYSKAAAQDYPSAYNALGNFYREGISVKADISKAFEMYRKGAGGEDAQAMLNLGNCYYYGMGVPKDEPAALKWWTKAAEAGNAFANAQMGDCHYHGIGVEKNLDQAVGYYNAAAEKNVPHAQYMLGILYYNGESVQQDQTYAKLLMQKARDGGMKEAQEFLDRHFKP